MKICELCGKETERPQGHHMSYDPEMVVFLCWKCHHGLHFLSHLTHDQFIKLAEWVSTFSKQWKNAGLKSKKSNYSKEHSKELHREYYKNNTDKILKRQREWGQKNKDKHKKYQKRWRDKNPDYSPPHPQKRDPEKCKIYMKEYRKKNKERIRQYDRNYKKKKMAAKINSIGFFGLV